MLGTQDLLLFVLSGVLLNITPGPDTLYILGRSVSQGRLAGVVSILGISVGGLVHTFAAAFGLSAIFATSATAFLVVKYLGAAYLIYLGLQMLLERETFRRSENTQPMGASPWAIFRAGLLTNVLNPKVALFFLAFLPQFVDPQSDYKTLPFLLLGCLFVTTGTLWCLAIVWCASAISRNLRSGAKAGRAVKRASGGLFVGLGVKLAVSE